MSLHTISVYTIESGVFGCDAALGEQSLCFVPEGQRYCRVESTNCAAALKTEGTREQLDLGHYRCASLGFVSISLEKLALRDGMAYALRAYVE